MRFNKFVKRKQNSRGKNKCKIKEEKILNRGNFQGKTRIVLSVNENVFALIFTINSYNKNNRIIHPISV